MKPSVISVVFAVGLLAYLAVFVVNLKDSFDNKEAITKRAVANNTETEPLYRAKATSQENRWYGIDRLSGKCEPSEAPSEMIKSFKAVGQFFQTVDDVVEDGKPMQVRLLFKDPSGTYQLIYYRGKERCRAEATRIKKNADIELIRYK